MEPDGVLCADCLKPVSGSRFCSETGYPHEETDEAPLSSCLRRASVSSFRRTSSALRRRPSTATTRQGDDGSGLERGVSFGNFGSWRKEKGKNSASFRHRMSVATGAVHQFKLNKEFTDAQNLGVKGMEDQRDELQDFVDDREVLLGNSGFRLNQFQDDCLQAIVARKAACKMLRGLRSKSITKHSNEPGHGGRGLCRTLVHRSVLNKGSIGKRFEAIKAAAAEGNKPPLSRPWSAPPTGRPDPPGINTWKKLTRSKINNPTLLAFASTESDHLQVLTTKINWGALLEQQSEQFATLDTADAGYREMLSNYEKYQRLIQRRLENLLSLDTLVP